MKAALWNNLHPNDPPRHGLIILDSPSKSGDGSQYVACGGEGAERLDETARRIVALWNAAEELELTTEKIAEGEIQRTFRLVDSKSGVIEAALERIEKLESLWTAILRLHQKRGESEGRIMSHTPGPWEVAENLFGNTASYEVYTNVGTRSGEGGYIRICQVTPRDQKTNAHLIAAAPEMLAVLEELRDSASYWSEYDVPLGIVDRIEDAIRKARGEE